MTMGASGKNEGEILSAIVGAVVARGAALMSLCRERLEERSRERQSARR